MLFRGKNEGFRKADGENAGENAAKPPTHITTPDNLRDTHTLTPDDLRWYFCQAESAAGIRSSHGALIDASLFGFTSGGRTNGAECRAAVVVDRAYGRTPEAPGTPRGASLGRRVRRRLQDLPEAVLAVLWAAYGPVPWAEMADRQHGRGTGAALTRRYGALVGVTLLTERVRRCAERTQRSAAQKGTVVVASLRDREEAVRIAGEARNLLVEAHRAVGVVVERRARVRTTSVRYVERAGSGRYTPELRSEVRAA